MNLIDAAIQAIAALEYARANTSRSDVFQKAVDAIETLRTAIADAERCKPAAWESK